MASSLYVRKCCACLFTARRLRLILAAVFAVAFSSASYANLIFDSMRYDGHVRTGATAGNEAHFTNVDLTSIGTGALPADNSALPAPLLTGFNLTTTLTEANDTFGGMPARHVILTISAPNSFDNFGGNSFHNTLDPTLALPVNFDAVVYSNALAAGQAINLKGVTVENFGGPFPPPGSQVITGVGNPALPIGSPGNPMRIQLGIAASQVDDYRYGFVKLNLFYGTQDIPEPTSILLMLLGFAGTAATAARNHR